MADEKKIDSSQGQIQNTTYGTIRVEDDVIASVAAITANQMDGVANTVGGMTENLTERLGIKNLNKGVRVDYKKNGYTILINIIAEYGYCIPDLAHNIQREVAREVEAMTGSKVHSVDLLVQGIAFDDEAELR